MRLFKISGLSTHSRCRLSARRVATRANSIGPPRSAALVIISAAVRTTGVLRSDDGTVLTRWTMASRNDASLTPQGSSMGSGKRLSQDTTPTPQQNRDSSEGGYDQNRCLIDGKATSPLFQGSFVGHGNGFVGPGPALNREPAQGGADRDRPPADVRGVTAD